MSLNLTDLFMFFSTNFTDASQHVNFYLTFRNEQDANLAKLLIGILVENAKRDTINNRVALVVGPLYVFETSLQQGRTQADVVSGGGGGGPGRTTPTTPLAGMK